MGWLLALALVVAVAIMFGSITARSDTLRILGFLIAGAILWSAVLLRLGSLSGGS